MFYYNTMYIDEYWSSYSGTSPSLSSGKKIRKTPRSADKVLDAPNLINDFCKFAN